MSALTGEVALEFGGAVSPLMPNPNPNPNPDPKP